MRLPAKTLHVKRRRGGACVAFMDVSSRRTGGCPRKCCSCNRGEDGPARPLRNPPSSLRSARPSTGSAPRHFRPLTRKFAGEELRHGKKFFAGADGWIWGKRSGPQRAASLYGALARLARATTPVDRRDRRQRSPIPPQRLFNRRARRAIAAIVAARSAQRRPAGLPPRRPLLSSQRAGDALLPASPHGAPAP